VANSKKLVLVSTSSGCLVPTSHKLNQDGYFRKRVWIDGVLKAVMYHRYVYEQNRGPIPEGYEVDHLCKNRACCNIDHLQLLPATIHRSKDNSERYASSKETARQFFKDHPDITGTELGKRFGVSFSTGCKWRKEFSK